jgi:hypothetical protein
MARTVGKTLGWIAAGGIGAGIIFLALAYVAGGLDLHRQIDRVFLARSCGDNGDKSGAPPAERRLAWTGGDKVDIAVSAVVRYRGGDGSEVVVRGPAGAIAHVAVDRSRISLDCRSFSGPGAVEITLPGRVFRRINLEGSGNLIMENVDQPELTLNVSGSGEVRAQGTAEHVTVKIAGSGNARLAELAMKQLAVDIAGSGNLEAAPKDEADVRIAGSGNVRLLSHPAQLRSKVAGSGRVTQSPLDTADKRERR